MSYAAPSLTASGTTFTQLQGGGVSAHLEKLIAAQVATVAPTSAPTATPTGGGSSGGLLAAGNYYLIATETNGIGETTVGPVSAQLAVSAGNIPQVTFPTLKTGNTARNLYITAISGVNTGPFTLYATGITTTTYSMSAVAPTNSYAMAPPVTNSTGLTYTTSSGNVQNKPLSLIRAAKDGNLEDVYKYLAKIVATFNEGDPIAFQATIQKLRHAHTAFLAYATVCNEIGVLLDANAGTLGTVATGIGGRKGTRTWP